MTSDSVLALREGSNLWDKLEGEPHGSWEAFKEYRNLPCGGRSVDKVAETLQKNVSGLRRWSKKWRWAERADAFDAHLESFEIDAIQFARLEASKRRINLADKLLSVAEAQLQRWLDDIDCGIRLDLSPYEVTRIIEIGYKIDRLERGESTDNTAVVIKDQRLTDLSQEQLMERAQCVLKEILEKRMPKSP
jgi:hypothetical protein